MRRDTSGGRQGAEPARAAEPRGRSGQAPLPPGTKVGAFVLDDVLGKPGGFGVTYAARHAVFDDRVAIKEFYPRGLVRRVGENLEPTESIDEEAYEAARKKFFDEAKKLCRVFRHPNIVEGKDCFEANGTVYFVMEFLEGETVGAWLAARPEPPDEPTLRAVFEPVLGVVGWLHDRGAMHRDLNPENIFLCADGRPKLIDFGTLGEGLDRLREGVTSPFAHPIYGAPEQMTTGRAQGAYTDVFCLAGVLYRAVTGARPPQPMAERTQGLIDGAGDPYAPLADDPALAARYPKTFLAGIDAGLKLSHRARPQSVDAFREALGWGRAAAAPPPEPLPRRDDPATEIDRDNRPESRGHRSSDTSSRPQAESRGRLPDEASLPSRDPGSAAQRGIPRRAQDDGPSSERPTRRPAALVLAAVVVAAAAVGAWEGWRALVARDPGPVAPVGTPQPVAVPAAPVPAQPGARDAPTVAVAPPTAAPSFPRCADILVRVAADARCLKPGDTFRDAPNLPEMVVIPAGSFTMGSPPTEAERSTDEGPQRTVTVPKPFAIGRYEVTFAEWDACVADGGCRGYKPGDQGWGRNRRPAVNVSWDDAKAYIAWLNRKVSGREDGPYRLPGEAEWEYAARAGTMTPFWTGPTITPDQANFNGDYTYNGSVRGIYRQRTVEVGSFPANPFGLHDVHGNVWEWVRPFSLTPDMVRRSPRAVWAAARGRRRPCRR